MAYASVELTRRGTTAERFRAFSGSPCLSGATQLGRHSKADIRRGAAHICAIIAVMAATASTCKGPGRGLAMSASATSVAKQMRPLFVLSLPRSGSTLLYTLLNQHSQIALLYEADLPTMRLFLHGQFSNGNWRERWEFWNQG